MFDLAAVRLDPEHSLRFKGGNIASGLDRLEAELGTARHLIGHNILRHDLPHLAAMRPQLSRLSAVPIDTLWLNPLAFPRNPYHRLVKHHHDGRLQSGHLNDPEADARLVFEVLNSQISAFRALNASSPDVVAVYHFLTTRGEQDLGFDALFEYVRGADAPSSEQTRQKLEHLLDGQACRIASQDVLDKIGSPSKGWPLAYSLAWISVAGGDSVMPPWVRKQFPEAARMVKRLRDTSCNDPECAWCRENGDPVKALSKWFGFDSFRATPTDAEGRPLQERIVDEGMRGQSLLGILPTGTGKSVCYQIPALSKFDRTGALSVVISPLVALMADQVAGMERSGISSAVTVNGLLSLPERQDALDKVRMGDAAMLLISPEQLRSVGVRSVLAQREIGLWVLDEAHCVSKWGHDFRPDYRYVSRFIKESSGDDTPATVICLTATAKPDVVRDIRDHFRTRLGSELLLLDGGASRTNLSFEVRSTGKRTKLADILEVIEERLPAEGASGAVIYCATRSATETVAEFLKHQGLSAECYHAGLSPDQKKTIQERFRVGDLRVIAATNAFGMGIDKPDIRLVVHGDIPGSLENYLQEAGRAGRDRDHANCVLLFAADDVERQFQLSARSRLARHEIGAILKAVRRMDSKTQATGTVVATSGEIVRQEHDREFQRESATDDTRVKTALSWLEEAKLLSREENKVSVFPSSLSVRSLAEVEDRLNKAEITGTRRTQLRDICRHLINAPADEGITTDELTGISGLTGGQLTKALADLEALGIAKNDTAVTVFVHHQVVDDSRKRLAEVDGLEKDLIALMREEAPDADGETSTPFNLQLASQRLRDAGHSHVRPDLLEKLLRGLARDGRDFDGGRGNLRLRKASRDTLFVALQRSWNVVEQSAALRRQAGENLVRHLLDRVPKGTRGKDLQVETTLGDMLATLTGDALLRGQVKEMTRLMDRGLLWLHEQNVVTLGKGLTVFRPAMTVQLAPGKAKFLIKDFAPLQDHYDEQTVQTHVMAAYAETGLASMSEAMRLSSDYFKLDQEAFLGRWLKGKTTEVKRQTTGASWKAIVEDLGNPVQQKIVADDSDSTNVLVLAGPGSGKTRVLVHRIAYLIRVRREDPRSILVLSYNRHAAVEIRARLRHLIGDDALAEIDPVAHGRVQILRCPPGDRMQAAAAVTELQRLAALDLDWSWSRTAIIARNWRQLAPVRAFADAQGIPVEMANEDAPSFWRLREMRQFIEGISRDRNRLLNVTDLLEVANGLDPNRWTDLIAEGIAALAQEIGTGSASVPDLTEWFGEWARDARGEQRGLLLMTAHRAKGLEFDDVVILEGGWDRPSSNEDPDAPRRLFYVGMTRARRSLAVMTHGAHAFLPSVGDNILRREATLPEVGELPADRAYQMPSLGNVFIDWPGRLREGDPSLDAIEKAKVGDQVKLVQLNKRWFVTDGSGTPLIAMRGGWGPPDGMQIRHAEIGAIVFRNSKESNDDFRDKLRRDAWEVVLPEILFE